MASQTENTTVQEISLDEIKAVVAELKKLSSKWAYDLAALLYPEEKDKVKGRERIYNIVNGSTRQPEQRNNFVIHANELKQRYVKLTEQTRENLNQIVNNK